MRRTPLNDGWSFRPKINAFLERVGMGTPAAPVTLPHDGLIGRERDPEGGAPTAFFPDGVYQYTRPLDAPEQWRGRTVLLEFEGVYRSARVFVNGMLAAGWAYGYSEFAVAIDPFLRFGETNQIAVDCQTASDSRWYSGTGMIRPVHLIVADRTRIARNGVVVTTPEVDRDGALVATAVTVENLDHVTRSLRVGITLVSPDGSVVGKDSRPMTLLPGATEVARSRVLVSEPRLWSAESPTLYEAQITLTEGSVELDSDEVRFGIRTLQLDPVRGLRVNGQTVKLRGACIHGDNGPLGGVSTRRAEERRIELLKAAGFNAVRASHHPLSRAMLDACDRLGMYVMDEYADQWRVPKSELDYANEQPSWWERDLEAMVAKDINHPSVVMYSIGNEIPESAYPAEHAWGRQLAEKVRQLDPTRYVTCAISGMLTAMVTNKALARARAEADDAGEGVNTIMTRFQAIQDQIMTSDDVALATEDAFAYLDVAGYNYMPSRYELEAGLFPNRVIVGTETHPPAIADYWAKVERLPYVIGDFTWTGWDYLGEVGVGRVEYVEDGQPPAGFMGGYPYLTAWTGDLTISGHRRPASYYRELVFGLRTEPVIAVLRPEHHGKTPRVSPWAWSDSVDSWSWGSEQRPVTVEVYGGGDSAELLVNGTSLGREPLVEWKARFETSYAPGEVTAVTYDGDRETGRTTLRTAGEVGLVAATDRTAITASSDDLAYVSIALADADGTVSVADQATLTVSVSGPGVLAGLCSDDPKSTSPFTGTTCPTFDGRALAVIRPTGPGRIDVTVTAHGYENVAIEISAV